MRPLNLQTFLKSNIMPTLLITLFFLAICGHSNFLFSQSGRLLSYHCERIITEDDTLFMANCASTLSDSTILLRIESNCFAKFNGYSEVKGDTLFLFLNITNDDDVAFSFCYYNVYYSFKSYSFERIKMVMYNDKSIFFNQDCKITYSKTTDKNNNKVIKKFLGNILKAEYIFDKSEIIYLEYENEKVIKRRIIQRN